MGKTLKFCLSILATILSFQLNAAESPQHKASHTETSNKAANSVTTDKSRPTLSELLFSMGAALNTGSYHMSLVYIHDGQVDSLRLTHLSEENNQYDMLEHLQGPRRMVVTHNNDTWLYSGNQRIHISSDEESPVIRWRRQLERLARNISNYKVVVSGVGRIAGRIAYQLNFISRDKSRHSSMLWIDAEHRLPLRLDSLNSENRIIEQILTVNLNYPASLTAEDFQVTEGFSNIVALINDSSQNQQLADYNGNWQINWVPAGFELSLRKFRSVESHGYEQWMYSDGLSTLSVFLEPASESDSNKKSTFVRGDDLIFDQISGNKRITVVGNIPVKTAEKIALSVSLNQSVDVSEVAPEKTP